MWYCVYWKEAGTDNDGNAHVAGQAFSFGDVIADPLPDQFDKKQIDGQPDFSKVQWNPQTLALEALNDGSSQ